MRGTLVAETRVLFPNQYCLGFGFCFCSSLIGSKGLSTVKEKNFKLFVTVQQQIFDTDFSNSVAKAVITACDVISFLFVISLTNLLQNGGKEGT